MKIYLSYKKDIYNVFINIFDNTKKDNKGQI